MRNIVPDVVFKTRVRDETLEEIIHINGRIKPQTNILRI